MFSGIQTYHSEAPFITHDAIVTTGDFSDPELVQITEMNNGSARYRWSHQAKPDGSIVFLHFIPKNAALIEKLEALNKGQIVEFVGKEEDDNYIANDDETEFVGLGHDTHHFFLLEDVRVQ